MDFPNGGTSEFAVADSKSAAKVIAVYRQLREGATEVDANCLFDAAERIVRAEEEAKTYRDTWGQSPLGQQVTVLGCATGTEAWRTTLPVMDTATAAREAAAEIEAKGQ